MFVGETVPALAGHSVGGSSHIQTPPPPAVLLCARSPDIHDGRCGREMVRFSLHSSQHSTCD